MGKNIFQQLHCHFIQVFIEGLDDIPDIWAHHTTMDQFMRLSRTAMISRTRGVRQLGPFLSPKELINAGIGYRMHFPTDDTSGVVYPNKFLNKDEEDHIVAGDTAKKLPKKLDDILSGLSKA